MMYSNVQLNVLRGTLSVAKYKKQIIRHYPGTNRSDRVPVGRPPTRISCTLKAMSEEEKLLIEQLIHGDQSAELRFDTYFYKDVITGDDCEAVPLTNDGSKWFFNAEFIALDPIPYSTATGEALY